MGLLALHLRMGWGVRPALLLLIDQREHVEEGDELATEGRTEVERGRVEGYRSLMPHGLKGVIVSAAATVFPFLPRVPASNPEGRCIRAVEVR